MDARHAARDQRARAASGYRVEDYLDDRGDMRSAAWPDDRRDRRPEDRSEDRRDLRFAERTELAPVVDYTDVIDEEQVWGPRPKLFASESGGRRTVVITGRGADRPVAPRVNARGGMPLQLRQGFAADRTAMWAVLLCVIVLLVAIGSH